MDLKDVENLADLARLELSQEEKQSMLLDMKGILEYVNVIESVKVEDVEPDYKVYNAWREDLPAQTGEIDSREFSRELIIEQFPDRDEKEDFLKVKKIIE